MVTKVPMDPGKLDVISLVAVSAAASNDAFEACRYGLAGINKMAGLKKTEMLERP